MIITPTQATLLGMPGTVLFALVLLFALAFFAYTMSRRIQLLTMGAGAPDDRLDRPWARFKSVLTYGLFQRKMFRDPYAGLYHALIFFGFIVLTVRTLSLVFEGLFPKAGLPFFPPGLWEGYLLLKDVVLVTTLAGVLLALGRRHVFKKARLDPSFDADLILVLIGFLMVSDLAAGAARFALLERAGTQVATFASIAGGANTGVAIAGRWEPLTYYLSKNLLFGLSPSSLQGIYFGAWWGHLVAILVFGNYLPFAKHFHVITALPNLYFAKLDPPGKMRTFDIEKAAETEKFGVSRIEDFTWKQKLDFFTCTECGRCREICPTHLTGKALSPKSLMVDLRNTLYAEADDLLALDSPQGEPGAAQRLAEQKPLIDGWVSEQAIWDCTTCRYCEHACPVGITYIDKITDMRRHLVLEKSDFPKEAQTAFNGMERQGNPWNLAASDRGAWAKDLPFPVLTMAEAQAAGGVEVLFWVGCAGSYEERGKKVSRALATLLHEAGVTYAILGTEETCTGDAARRLGNEYLFQTLAQQNVETMNGYGVKKIVTNCPHCFNTLAREYPDFGGNYEVLHGTELVAKLVAEGRIRLTERVETSIAFHDPCYLGRHNAVYDAPRDVLNAIPGLTVTEIARSRDKGMCCGAGGGRMWLDENTGTRINQARYAEFQESGAAAVGVACPFCMVMLGNAKTELSGSAEPYDVLELAARALPVHPAGARPA